jgi:hypothetical protein
MVSQIMVSFADRGAGKRKAKVVLNIKTNGGFVNSLNFNLKTGLKYTGSFMLKPNVNNNLNKPFAFNSFLTYQKGNSVYVLPYKQKLIVSEIQKGINGPKLIIRLK